MIEHDAIELAKLTPASGWSPLDDPATVKLSFTKPELEARIRRAYRQLVEGCPRRGDATHQQWADRIGKMGAFDETEKQEWFDRHAAKGVKATVAKTLMHSPTASAKTLFHTIRVAYLNMEGK